MKVSQSNSSTNQLLSILRYVFQWLWSWYPEWRKLRDKKLLQDTKDDLHQSGKKYTLSQRYFIWHRHGRVKSVQTDIDEKTNHNVIRITTKTGEIYKDDPAVPQVRIADESIIEPFSDNPNPHEEVSLKLNGDDLIVYRLVNGEKTFKARYVKDTNFSLEHTDEKTRIPKVFASKPNKQAYAGLSALVIVIAVFSWINLGSIVSKLNDVWPIPPAKQIPVDNTSTEKMSYRYPAMTQRAQGHVAFAQYPQLPMKQLFGTLESLDSKKEVGRQLRYMVLLQDLKPQQGQQYLDTLIKNVRNSTITLKPADDKVLSLLAPLYAMDAEKRAKAITQLAPKDKAFLIKYLDWFGLLAVSPQSLPKARDALVSPIQNYYMKVFAGMFAFLLFFVIGLKKIIFHLTTSIAKTRPMPEPTGFQVEAIAIWFVFTVMFNIFSLYFIAPYFAEKRLLIIGIVNLLSASVILWPVVRGQKWSTVKRLTGFHTGSGFCKETFTHGFGNYPMLLPILAVAAGVNAWLNWDAISEQLPAHALFFEIILASVANAVQPIIELALMANTETLAYIGFLVVFVAPVVEEIIFRILGYRPCLNLFAFLMPRIGRKAANCASALLTTVLLSAWFAIIHPGMIGLPVIFALAVGFAMKRRERDCGLPAIAMHMAHNGLVYCMILFVLRAML